MYEETQRQLQITVDQYGIAQRRLQALTGELEEMRANMEAVSALKRVERRKCDECFLKLGSSR